MMRNELHNGDDWITQNLSIDLDSFGFCDNVNLNTGLVGLYDSGVDIFNPELVKGWSAYCLAHAASNGLEQIPTLLLSVVG